MTRHDVEFERARIHRIMDELDLPAGQFVLSGSAPIVLAGIQRGKPMGDLDVFLATRPWVAMLLSAAKTAAWRGGLDGASWEVWTTDPTDPMTRCDPPYLHRIVCGLEVNIFSSWRVRGIADINAAEMIEEAETVDGLPCIPLELIYGWKLELGRSKDIDDLALLRDHLGVA